MVAVDTFLTPLYVMVDDFRQTSLPLEDPPGASGSPHAQRGGNLGALRPVARLGQ